VTGFYPFTQNLTGGFKYNSDGCDINIWGDAIIRGPLKQRVWVKKQDKEAPQVMGKKNCGFTTKKQGCRTTVFCGTKKGGSAGRTLPEKKLLLDHTKAFV